MRWLLVIPVIFLCGCDVPAIETNLTNNQRVMAEKLFSYKGYEVIRFSDGGRKHYFVIGGNADMMESQTYSSGKSSYTVSEEIPTRV